MTKDQVNAAKAIIGTQNYTIYTDAGKFYSTADKYTHIIWDDAHELFYAIQPSNDHYHQNKQPFEVTAIWYTAIDSITVFNDSPGAEAIMLALKTAGLMSDAEILDVEKSYEDGKITHSSFPGAIAPTEDPNKLY